MKKILVLLFSSFCLFLFSQTNELKADKLNYVTEEVDKVAEFEGGINSFRQLVVNNINTNHIKCAKGITRSSARFVVERDGLISNIEITGDNITLNNEFEKAIKAVKGIWKPAIVKGYPVRSYYRFPFALNCS